jgi:hypothetical protein
MPTPEEMLKLATNDQKVEKEVLLQFDKPNAPYWVGETARFSVSQAKPFIDAGKAHWIADISEEQILAEQAALATKTESGAVLSARLGAIESKLGINAPTGEAPVPASGQSKR